MNDNSSKISQTMLQIKSRAQAKLGRKLTNNGMAKLAGVSKRSVDEWMRGAINPSGTGLLLLLSLLDTDDLVKVVDIWKATEVTNEQHVK